MSGRSVDWLEPWRALRRVWKARHWGRWARDTSACAAGEAATARAARLYRKALRVLNPGTLASASLGSSSSDVVALRAALARDLRARGLGAGLRRRLPEGLRLARPAAMAAVAVALFIAAAPAGRRWLAPTDLAAGKPWRASSTLAGFPASGSVSNPADDPVMFHTLDEPSPSLVVDLTTVVVIRKVRIANRRDCCRERALPLAVEVGTDGRAWKRVAYRRSDFETWTASFPPVPARYVRLRVDRQSSLHLRMVAVY